MIASDSDKASLQSRLTSIQKDLEFAREQISNKNAEYQAAINELSMAYRNAEDGRLTTIQELETKKYELSDVESRLNGVEQRMQRLHQDFIQADTERDLLSDALRRFQNSIGRTVNDKQGQDGLLSNGDIDIPSSLDGKTKIDPSQLESALQAIARRIERLRSERDQYRNDLNRLKQKPVDTTIITRETHYKTIEDSLDDAEEEKRSLEARLATVKRLLKSQEETMKEREEERRQLKGKVITAELEVRGRDSQIRHLNVGKNNNS